MFHHYALQHKQFSISVLFFSSYHRHRAERRWRVTDSYCVLLWAAPLSVKITSRASPLHPNASAMTCLAMCDGAERSVVGLWGLDWVELLQTHCGGRAQSERHSPSENYQCSFSHPRPYSDLSLSNPVWHFGHTAVCNWGKKREKWDMKCQLFKFDCVRQ